MTYKEQLLDPRWQKKRLKILERDNWECQYCGSNKKTLHVHHLLYDSSKLAWECEDNCLSTLCEDCHAEFHKEVPAILSSIKFSIQKNLKDLFILNCAKEVFEEWCNLNDLIYLLWEVKDRQEEVLQTLREEHFSDVSNLTP